MNKTIKLSEINIENLTDADIDHIVFSGVVDDQRPSEYCIVFGNQMLMVPRVDKAIEAYKSGRVKKFIFTGGRDGVSNQNVSSIAEAERMRDYAIANGIKAEDITIETEARNSFENVDNSVALLPEGTTHISIITSEFHLKRCVAIFKLKYPNIAVTTIAARDGFTDRNNWMLSDNSWNTGRSMVTWEAANTLLKYAKEGKIFDLELENIWSKEKTC